MPDDGRPDAGLLSAILAEVLALRREVAALRRPADVRLGALLMATFDTLSDSSWSAAEVFAIAMDDVPGRADLRASLLAIVGPKPAGAVRRAGRFLADNEGAEAEGLRLERLPGRGRDGLVYRVVDVIGESP